MNGVDNIPVNMASKVCLLDLLAFRDMWQKTTSVSWRDICSTIEPCVLVCTGMRYFAHNELYLNSIKAPKKSQVQSIPRCRSVHS